jgi:GTP-binding protein Era
MKSGLVVLLGRPNVGKSTFLNKVLKEQISIVTPKAQTTRDQVRGIVSDERGQIVFIDTPGVHRAREGGINDYMIQEVRRALDGPDLVLYLIDPMSHWEAESLCLDQLKLADSKVIVVVNKVDFKKKYPGKFEWLEKWVSDIKMVLQSTQCQFLKVVEISAERNRGVKELVDEIFEILPEGPPLYDDPETLTDRSMRFVVAELVRKQLFLNLGDEIPYSCAVEVLSFKENVKPVHISAMIYVERESQKGMVIGAQGKKIKEIGTAARIEIEKLLGCKIFLELRVKVLNDWTSEASQMKSLGYDLEIKRKPKRKSVRS